MKKLTCENCNFEWVPRIQDPKACPNCKQYRKPKKKKTVLTKAKIKNYG